MPTSATIATDEGHAARERPGGWLKRARMLAGRPEMLALAILAIGTLVRLQGSVDPDVSWQLWIADRIHHGARLYRDIVEVNPPLWFWMALPVDSLAKLLGVRADALMILVMAAAAALSIIATARLLTGIPERRRSLLLAYAAVTLFAMPWMHVGQREQIALIGAVPYAALVAARRSGRPVSPLLAVLIGAGAALGFALKHYFLIVPALLELWLYAGRGKSWRPFRPETFAIAAVGAAYACAVLFWARDFFTITLPLIRLAYGATGAPHFTDLFGPPIIVAFLLLGFIALHRRLDIAEKAPFAAALLVAGLGFGAAYFIQSKGWLYHAMPLVGCLALALASLLAEIAEPPRSLRLIGPALLALPLTTAAQESRAETLPSPELLQSVEGLPPGTTVGFIATEPALAWSVTLQHRLHYPSRYYGFWMIRAILRNQHRPHPDPRIEQLRKDVAAQTVLDFECTPPRRIVVARPSSNGPTSGDFDILPFFLEDPRFAAMLAHYRSVRRGEKLEIYDLQVPFAAPPRSSCRRGA
ncbi:MAG: hypothetical protein ACM3ZV_06080 [Bacillota bacterium]